MLHCVFMELEKAYFRVPREELWYRKRKSRVAEKCVRTYTHLNSDVSVEKDVIINKIVRDTEIQRIAPTCVRKHFFNLSAIKS